MQIEHSLRSIAAWESKMHKSYFTNDKMSVPDLIEYIRCMTVKPPKDPTVYNRLSKEDIMAVLTYMNDPMTAKTFYNRKKRKGPESMNTMTVENIYFLMIEYGIPFSCENWHFGRLMALIKTCENNNGGERMSHRERQQWWNELNDQRRKRLGSKG